MLNETGKQVVVSILVVIAGISFCVLLVYAFRRVVRYSLKTTKVVTKIVEEEKQKQDRENQGSGPGYSSPSPFPVISSK
jgi:hypothetical protein